MENVSVERGAALGQSYQAPSFSGHYMISVTADRDRAILRGWAMCTWTRKASQIRWVESEDTRAEETNLSGKSQWSRDNGEQRRRL